MPAKRILSAVMALLLVAALAILAALTAVAGVGLRLRKGSLAK